MTTEPSRENYPIDPEVEKTFTADEVFEIVKGAFADPEFEIHEGLVIGVGRRAGDNAAKGFSTDAEKAKIFCPGPLNEDARTATQVTKTVVKSILTIVRHELNPVMPETKSKKGPAYLERQDALAEAIIVFAGMSDVTDDEVREALALLVTRFNEFMTRESGTDIDRMDNSLNGIVHLIRKLNYQFTPDTDQ